MYNHFIQEKEQRLTRELKRIKKYEVMQHSHYTEKENPKWLANYKKRMEGFVITMIDRPVVSHEYRDFQYQPRPYDPSKFVGSATMYFQGFRRQQERINSSLQRNSSLDAIPFGNTSSHRFRDLNDNSDQKLHERVMRYKPCTTVQRIDDCLKQQRMNELDYSGTRLELSTSGTTPNLRSTHLSHDINSLHKNKRGLAKQILPTLHQKTHYKALQEIFNDFPVGIINVKEEAPTKKPYAEEEASGPSNSDEVVSSNKFYKYVKSQVNNNLGALNQLNNNISSPASNSQSNSYNQQIPTTSHNLNREDITSSQAKRVNNKLTSPSTNATSNNKKAQGIQNFYPKETSREAMVKCGLLSSNTTHEYLQSGAGREPHSDSLTYSKLYNNLYGAQTKKMHFMQE